MVHSRDRYRKETDNTCLEVSISLLAIALIIFLGVFLILAISHISGDTTRITSKKSVKLASNDTVLEPIKVMLQKAVILRKENLTFYPINIETSSNHKSLARKGRFIRRKLVDLDSEYD